MSNIEFTSEITCRLIASECSDLAVVNAARVSFDQQAESLEKKDEGLIGYLMREHHGSPFEHGYFRFHVEVPIFVVREHHRHRAGHSYNEMSGRYTKLEPKFYLPETARVQEGKPGAYTYKEQSPNGPTTNILHLNLTDSYTTAWGVYEHLLAMDVAKEQARLGLPVAIFTKYQWSCNPRSLMHFLNLRTAPNAMKEIRMLASLAEEAFKQEMPVTYGSWLMNNKVAP